MVLGEREESMQRKKRGRRVEEEVDGLYQHGEGKQAWRCLRLARERGRRKRVAVTDCACLRLGELDESWGASQSRRTWWKPPEGCTSGRWFRLPQMAAEPGVRSSIRDIASPIFRYRWVLTLMSVGSAANG